MAHASPLAVFFFASLALVVVPGPSVLYIVTRSIDQGRRAGLASVVGVASGGMVHVTAAALGLSAMLASSAVAFSFVKYLGAAYLIYLGVRTLISEPHEASGQEGPPLSVRRIYAQGLMVEALNPKVALFFLAFLPQFIDPLQGSVLYQTLLLGTIFVAIGVCSDSVYALVAGSAGGWLSRQRALSALRRSLAGCVYLGLGVATALSGDHGR